MKTISEEYWKWFSGDDNNGTEDAYYAGYELAQKELEEQLKECKEIIDELFEWDNLTSNEIYKLQERFKNLEKWK